MAPTLSLADLPADARAAVKEAVRRQTGKSRVVRERTFTVEHERRYALRVCALVADLTQEQRRRVLKRAGKVNEV